MSMVVYRTPKQLRSLNLTNNGVIPIHMSASLLERWMADGIGYDIDGNWMRLKEVRCEDGENSLLIEAVSGRSDG